MINLTNLVIEYKSTKNKIHLDKIYKELFLVIQQKAKYIYFVKWYPLNLYHPCKYCRNCIKLKNVPKEEHNLICKDCQECKCIKGFFNLHKNNLCEYEDVENDIWLEVLRIIDNFDITKDFNTYLFSCLWEFIPTFITQNFIKSMTNKSLVKVDEDGNEIILDISDGNQKLRINDFLNLCQNEKEKTIVQLLSKGLTQKQIANKLKYSQQNISLIIKKLQEKIKKELYFS